MSSAAVIQVENLSKAFRIYNRPVDCLKEVIFRKRFHDTFWALRNVTFSIQPKQRLAVIGPNGCGKSTLLRIITAHLDPTHGTVRVDGKVSAMLSLNSFLNPEHSGFENIRFSLMVNGCPRSQIEDKVEDVVEFAELGPFIYKPVKTYSSGMSARLSFALTTALEPDVLVVDEVLSVGDAYFVGKAIKRMIDICTRGRALLFVTHSMADAQRLCDTALWLDQGMVRDFGPIVPVTRKYEEDYRRQEDQATRELNERRREQITGLSFLDEMAPDLIRLRICPSHVKGYFAGVHYIRNLTVESNLGRPVSLLPEGKEGQHPDPWVWLDVLGCEWGRAYEHKNSECRLLHAQTGRRHGGQLLVRRPKEFQQDCQLTITFEVASDNAAEELAVQWLDIEQKGWVPAEVLARVALSDGWQQVRCRLRTRAVPDEQFKVLKTAFYHDNRPDVEIETVELWTRDGARSVITEGEPFEVRATIRANRLTAGVDVGIRITRSDGTYVFWQSSGETGGNIEHLSDWATVSFSFDPNYLGGGQYLISAYCANGWDVQKNYPYTEVYSRLVNVSQFTVTPADPRVDRGQLNMRVPVQVARAPLRNVG
jgi:ABC-type polysaccharide/polyol phosphate transport system ATPase subunit